jgi:hypothetical protein
MNELKPVKHPLIYNAPGDYYPAIDGDTVVWRKDTTGDAAFAVHVPNIANVRKFATLVRIESYEQEGL